MATPPMYSMRDCEWCKHGGRLTPVAAQLDCAAFASWMKSTSWEKIATTDPDRTTCFADTLKNALRDTPPSRVPADGFPYHAPEHDRLRTTLPQQQDGWLQCCEGWLLTSRRRRPPLFNHFPPPPSVSPRTRVPRRSQCRGAYLKRRDGRLILRSFTGDTPALDQHLQLTIKHQQDNRSSLKV